MATFRTAWKRNPGLVLSGGAHVLAFVLMVANFSRAPKIDDAIETVPVEMISASELNEITTGEKTAKLMPVPQRRVDKVAEIEDHKPVPPTIDAKKDTPPPPSPDKATDDPGHSDKPPEPATAAALPPPAPPTPTPPAPPPPVVPPPPTPVAKTEPQPDAPLPPPKPDVPDEAKDEVKPDAEAIEAPKPPPRPKIKEAKVEPKPVPVPHPRPPEKVAKVVPPPPPKRPDPKPAPKTAPTPPDKVDPKSMLDDVASLLSKLKPPKPAEKPRSGNEVKEAKSHDDFSFDKISALLDHDAPQRKQSTGHALTQMASLGSPTAHAEKMSPSMAAQLDGWLIDHYRGCWSYFGLGATKDYVPQLRIRLAQDGTLIGQPALLNPPNDPNLRSLADSAMRAVNRCNPLGIPERFRPYYDQGYKQRVIRFDPKEMS